MKLKIGKQIIDIKVANTFFKRFKGFMGKKNINYGILFKHTSSIHTFFMKENIDVIAIDNHNKVIYKAINIPKNKILTIHNKTKNTSILELPANTSIKVKIGDYLSFISE